MLFKPEVNTRGVQAPIWYALGVAGFLMQSFFRSPLKVNSLNDSTHQAGSLHYQGLAADLHTTHLSDVERNTFNRAVAAHLEPLGFDVVLETKPVHTHIEYDPKKGEQWVTVLTAEQAAMAAPAKV